jgi:hypothetical protein
MVRKPNPAACLLTRPRKVALLGLGVSIAEYNDEIVTNKGKDPFDEVWGVNMGCDLYRHDKLFVMDDLRVQARKFPTYGQRLARHDRPIITSAAYPEYPMSVRFPIEEAIKTVGDDFFTNTVCYALAYAMMTQVKDLYIYGCDFWYPNCDLREEGAMNAAYFLGMMRSFGINFHLPQSTTLLSAHRYREGGRPLYGYAVQPFAKTQFDYSEHQRNEGEVPGDANEAIQTQADGSAQPQLG